jgi:hypothetical protein
MSGISVIYPTGLDKVSLNIEKYSEPEYRNRYIGLRSGI